MPFSNLFVKKVVQDLTSGGHEWKRAKWSAPVRKYWKYSEKVMVCGSDLVVCDSKNIEKYIRQEYGVKNTTFIAYGAETEPSKCSEEKYEKWLSEKGLRNDCCRIGFLWCE